ncbi:hypothetical protein FKW77_008229 [Venturia effusa]|uniref:Monooxygenase n=1 Tax=Venturia effusa TaxID=50376 RepID=A0A517L9R2_9PEZI|nr:hypothetical protein FKW77_008229 [Venturia effusa]
MNNFRSLTAPSGTQPTSTYLQSKQHKNYLAIVLKDQMTLSSWLAIGACFNSLLLLAIGRIALLLPFLLVTFRIGDAVLQTYGFKKNPLMDGGILSKYSAQFPNQDGTFGPKPASEQIVVFLIGARSNHPMGALAPGFKRLGDFFDSMIRDVEAHAEEYTYLGSSDWIANAERSTGNEIMTVIYFKTSEGLHNYAHGELHRQGWNWWNKNLARFNHLSIWHEVYVAPKGHWENIYINTRPLLMGATAFPVKTEAGTKWVSPVVDASRGVLKSSRGRMTLGDGTDYEMYAPDPYAKE